MPMTLAAGNRRTLLGMVVALVLVAAVVLTLGANGQITVLYDRTAGRPTAVVEDVPGPETGPACPLDERYVNEKPRGLRPDVLDAWRQLGAAARRDGVRLCLNDGKRSRAQQQREFDDAVTRFGSRELAAEYVLPPEESMHVTGIAVDIQPLASAAWVEDNGSALGWCRRYENEEWHFEYDPSYPTDGCPPMLPSATGS